MRLNLSHLFFSPLEQFEISAYNTTLSYITTYPLQLIENTFFLNYDPVVFYNIIDLIFILFILKAAQLWLKTDGFIFLYIFILTLTTCFNLYAFTDFIMNRGSFTYYDFTNKSMFHIRYILESNPLVTFAPGCWSILDNGYYLLINENYDDYKNLANLKQKSELGSSFLYSNLIPNLEINIKLIVAYTWFLGYLFYKGFPINSNDDIPLEICNSAVNKYLVQSNTATHLNWNSLFNDFDFIYLINVFIPHYENYINAIREIFLRETGNMFTDNINTLNNWIFYIMVIVAIMLASKPHLLGLYFINENKVDDLFKRECENLKSATVSTCHTGACSNPSSRMLISFIEKNVPTDISKKIASEIIFYANKTFSEIAGVHYITLEKSFHIFQPFMLTSLLERLNFNLNHFNIPQNIYELFSLNTEDNFFFVTINTSFINMYSIFFCFIFIFLIVYLLFNKSLTFNNNNIIPNIYQTIGENIFKTSLNLFYSVLGKYLTHPEFFIKINTIFLFLIISNVQGMIPYMSTLTSALTNTFFIALALFISILTTLFDKKGFNYFLNLFMPSGCPIFLVLLLIPIEIISYSFRVVSLSVRLFANMMAGHTLLKVIVGFSWVIVFLGNTSLINIFPIIILFILTLLEFGVAFIQSYIFTILSCIYLRDIFQGH